MSQPQAAILARFVADDPRADSGKREVGVAAEAIAIDRCVAGVRMRLSVPVRSFRGVVLALHQSARGLLYRVILAHADPELDLVLAEAENEKDIAPDWLAWAQFFRLPRLARSAQGDASLVEGRLVEGRLGEVRTGTVQPRRRGWPLKERRSAMSARRKAGAKGRVLPVHCGEREIICYE
ncbi:DUF6101 family protein [Rhodoblastus acidophilus]|uniref:DUF6101 family protein n=1 Tax=Candidatus Rhodoblastus alkanivorans TaxID=2954117 RepID=A0ABS9Z533_9HYPH|nr:DUF6101 family protein [Candidatus Rhodoblastus alkanivorans]MCI4677687.1 DUF6101 family protein [Candidatus Rhodoblastus alkanivorans]MCI4682581.1 DUF6101 family protein [Candidatus Rhodoblastus alkanivorans]MDI4639887.1 DUF6101 family protein [Rhodoblastus acidophilus]